MVTAPTEARGRIPECTFRPKPQREGLPFTALIIDVRSNTWHQVIAGGAVIELLNDASVSARYSVWAGLSQTDQQIGTGRLFIRPRLQRAVECLCIISIFYGTMKNTTATTTTALKSAHTVAFDQAGQ